MAYEQDIRHYELKLARVEGEIDGLRLASTPVPKEDFDRRLIILDEMVAVYGQMLSMLRACETVEAKPPLASSAC